jgi:hypothetical protein
MKLQACAQRYWTVSKKAVKPKGNPKGIKHTSKDHVKTPPAFSTMSKIVGTVAIAKSLISSLGFATLKNRILDFNVIHLPSKGFGICSN